MLNDVVAPIVRPRLAWSVPDLQRVIGSATVVAQIRERAQLVNAVDGSAIGKPVGGGHDAEWALTVDDRLARLDDGVVAVIDPETGKPRHQVAVPGARRLVAAGGRLFAWGKPDVHCVAGRGDDALAVTWSAPCDHVNHIFTLGERVVIGGYRRTRVLALADGRELRAMPGTAVLADDLGLVLDAGGAYVITDLEGATSWRTSSKQFQPLALLRDAVVATQTRPDLLAGPVVVLERATGKPRVTLPEAEPARRVFADGPTQKIVAVADGTIYLAEGVKGRAQPVQAFDAQGTLRWTLDVTFGAGHHINVLDAADRRLLGVGGSGRAFCIVEAA